MKKFFVLSLFCAFLGLCAVSTPAEARSFFSFNVGALFAPCAPAPVYVQPVPVPAPVYVYPETPFASPVYAPAPVYYVPAPARPVYVYPQPCARPSVGFSFGFGR